jgi:hypothetical protein
VIELTMPAIDILKRFYPSVPAASASGESDGLRSGLSAVGMIIALSLSLSLSLCSGVGTYSRIDGLKFDSDSRALPSEGAGFFCAVWIRT